MTRPEIQATDTWNSWLPFFSSNPNLFLQISQCTSWNEGIASPVLNVWRPGYFGVSLPRIGSDPIKLNGSNDLIVTLHGDDIMETLKAKGSGESNSQSTGSAVGIEITPHRFFRCRVCYCHRGTISLPIGELWSFTEIDGEHYQFKRVDDGVNKSVPTRSLVWQFCNSWAPPKDLPADLPFAVNRDARVCRINELGNDYEPRFGKSLAVMNREGCVLFDEVESKMAGIQSDAKQWLILLSALAIARYEGWLVN
ncbi:uncharacterized protein N7529_004700 [Penicillium soppii]|uniref:uncharacterized protein n=1 Tax=Penicillium soppii TaxID=69789 RepID=UPI0025472312|nr:uncharacterized protein N7529_004700 [Penicillium soppii]KAJ5872347.1 hypothetical protein N7529_004700 [Penicillium soppii]